MNSMKANCHSVKMAYLRQMLMTKRVSAALQHFEPSPTIEPQVKHPFIIYAKYILCCFYFYSKVYANKNL